jgi:hypothetical protein
MSDAPAPSGSTWPANTTPDGRHALTRKGNPFTRSSTGGRILSVLMLPGFTLHPPAGYGVLTTIGRRTGKTRHLLRLPTVAAVAPDQRARERSGGDRALGDRPARPDALYLRLLHRLAGRLLHVGCKSEPRGADDSRRSSRAAA